MHKHSDMQARADSMRGFYERSKAEIVSMQARRAELDCEFREARDGFRWQIAHWKRQQARAVHARIQTEMRNLASIKHTLDRNQESADLQAEPKRRSQEQQGAADQFERSEKRVAAE